MILVGVGLAMEGGETPPLWLYGLALLLILVPLAPILAVSVRRLHDRNKSGWWMLGCFGAPMLLAPGLKGEPAILATPLAELNAILALLGAGLSVVATVTWDS